MVCAEEIEPDSSPDTHLFWKGCNHVYHRACIVEAKKQGVEGCPRCWELTEASLWLPSIVQAEERATQAAATQVDAEEEEGEEEEEESGCSMGEDGSDKEAVAAEEPETQPWDTNDVEAACLGVPKQEKQDFGVPKQDLDARVLEVVEVEDPPDAQPPSPTLSPRAAAPKAQPEPAKPKGKKRRGGALATAGPAPDQPEAALPPAPSAAVVQAPAADQPEAALPPALSAALVQAPSADQLVEHRQVRCWLCTRLFNLVSDDLKKNDDTQKHKCKTCCKVDTASPLI